MQLHGAHALQVRGEHVEAMAHLPRGKRELCMIVPALTMKSLPQALQWYVGVFRRPRGLRVWMLSPSQPMHRIPSGQRIFNEPRLGLGVVIKLLGILDDGDALSIMLARHLRHASTPVGVPAFSICTARLSRDFRQCYPGCGGAAQAEHPTVKPPTGRAAPPPS